MFLIGSSDVSDSFLNVMRIISRWLISLAIVLLILVLESPVAYAVPQLPHSFYGTLEINGQDAPIGTVVKAKFSELEFSTYTTTEAGKYGDNATSDYFMVIWEGLHSGDIISFYVNGVDTGETYLFESGGGPTELNLTVDMPPVGLLGDANSDGVVNALDITEVERIIAGLAVQTPGADANQDGKINACDITKVERIIAGLN